MKQVSKNWNQISGPYLLIVLLLMLRIISSSASLVTSGMSSIISVSTRDPPLPNDTLKFEIFVYITETSPYKSDPRFPPNI